jgi:hypothetical protein
VINMTGDIPNPLGSGTATLRVDREAVPALRTVFDKALAKLDVQIDQAITRVRVAPWAGDPISQEAATSFNDHAINTPSSALNALLAYQQRLQSASDALQQVANAYQIVEGDNAASFRDQE